MLDGADELQRADDEEESDDDPRPGEPGVEGGGLEHRYADKHGPRSGEEVAETLADRDAEVGWNDSKATVVASRVAWLEAGSVCTRASSGTWRVAEPEIDPLPLRVEVFR